MQNIKLDHSIPLVSAEKNFFMIIRISMVTLDLSKLSFYLIGRIVRGEMG